LFRNETKLLVLNNKIAIFVGKSLKNTNYSLPDSGFITISLVYFFFFFFVGDFSVIMVSLLFVLLSLFLD
jgi:hypothetical protein